MAEAAALLSGSLAQLRPEEAEIEYLPCLAAAESKLGPSHPRTLNLRINLGTLLEVRGMYELAEDFFRRVIRDAQASVGTQSREWCTAMNNLCANLLKQNRASEAGDLAGILLDEIIKDRGSDDIDALRCGLTLAVAWYELGRTTQAYGLVQCALEAFPEGTREHMFAEQLIERYGRGAQAQPKGAAGH